MEKNRKEKEKNRSRIKDKPKSKETNRTKEKRSSNKKSASKVRNATKKRADLEDEEELKEYDEEEEVKKDIPKGKKRRKMGKKSKIIIAVFIIIIILIIGLWGMHSDTSYPSVSDIVNNKEKHLDKHIEVKGTVGTDSLDLANKTFNLTDGKNDLKINYNGSLPSNFEEGKDIVVKGTLHQRDELFLVAEEIEVGCASKY